MLRKYGVGFTFIIPIVKAGVSDFAVAADWTPAAGDVSISKDGGAAANLTTLPEFITSVGWKFTVSATEAEAGQININIVDQDATKAIEDQHVIIETYGNASALHPLDLGTALASQTIGTCTTNTDMITAATILTTAMTEAYAEKGATRTLAEALYEMLAELTRQSTTGTSRTTLKIDNTTPAKVYTFDDAGTPTARTEA